MKPSPQHTRPLSLMCSSAPRSPIPRQGVFTPLFWAARNGHEQAVALLLASQADTEACNPVRGMPWGG